VTNSRISGSIHCASIVKNENSWEFLNVSGRYQRIIWKTGMVQELLLTPNQPWYERPKNLTDCHWLGSGWHKSQTKEMSTAIGMLSVLLSVDYKRRYRFHALFIDAYRKTGKIRSQTWASLVVRGQATLIVIWKLTTIQAIHKDILTLYLDARVFSKRYKCVHNVS
jgi:hypothetical protein